MRRCLLLLACCGAALSQLRVPAGRAVLPPRGKRPGAAPAALTTFAEPPGAQVGATPPSPPPVVEAPEDDDFSLEDGPPPQLAFRPSRPPPPPLPPVDADQPLATRRPELPRPAFRPSGDARPSFRPSPSTPIFRSPAPTLPPLDDFSQPQPQLVSRTPLRQPTRPAPAPEPQLRGTAPPRVAPPPSPPQYARPTSQLQQRNRKPVSQVISRYRDDNPDGSITWGFENDDGTFKEETIGVDCVVKGKYGYVDPDGVRREYSYSSGIPCDKDKDKQAQSAELDFEPASRNKAPPSFRN